MPNSRVAVITGATKGIGREIALELARSGASIVAIGTDAAALEEVVAAVQHQNGSALGISANIALPEDIERIFEEAMVRFGRVDILVNNAGITKDGLLLRMKDDDWDAVMNVNLKGAFLCSRAAAKIMTKQRYGRIINITSVVGQMGNSGQANYCASKAGLIGLTKSVARELAKRNITVNAVAPGFIETAMTASLSEKVREELASQIPLERFGTVQDIANAVSFLASEQAGYITGQVLAVNGGMYM